MTESKVISVRLDPSDPTDLSLIQFLSGGTSAVSQLRNLWKAVADPKKGQSGQLANHIIQLRHVLERCDSDRILRRMTEEEYVDTLKAIESTIRHLEERYL